MSTQSGGTFFPLDAGNPSLTQGATLRDYFAGLIAAAYTSKNPITTTPRSQADIARESYDLAQALVDEKNRRGS